jgi:hypothetical protein
MTFARLNSDSIFNISINAQTGTSYTLQRSDHKKLIEIANSSAITLTIPPESSVNFPIGTNITIVQTASGQITISAGAGVTVNSTPGLKLRTQWSSVTLVKRSSDLWVAIGDLVA